MTPIFSRSWLVKTSAVFDRLMAPVSLRSAWLIRRACRPTKLSPISPSISARGTSAATESTITTSTPLERIRVSAISSACSPVSGWLTSSSSTLTPTLRGVGRVQRVLRVDEGRDAAVALRAGGDVVAERRLAARLRPEDLGDAATRNAADPQGQVERDRSGGDDVDVLVRALVAEAHDRPSAELLLDLQDGGIDGACVRRSLAVPLRWVWALAGATGASMVWRAPSLLPPGGGQFTPPRRVLQRGLRFGLTTSTDIGGS